MQSKFVDWPYIEYVHDSEAVFNDDLAEEVGGICLDKKDISPRGQTQIEPCDVLIANNAIFIHVKRSTLSGGLSHLFNQGANSYEVLSGEAESVQKLLELVDPYLSAEGQRDIEQSISTGQVTVWFAITTHKDVSMRSGALPLFSKISAYRTLKSLDRYRVNCQLSLVPEGGD